MPKKEEKQLNQVIHLSLDEYKDRAFEALNKVLDGNNGAALIAAAKMIFDATGVLKPEKPPETTGPQIVEFWQEGTPEDASADANGPTKNRLEGYTIPTGDNKQSGQN